MWILFIGTATYTSHNHKLRCKTKFRMCTSKFKVLLDGKYKIWFHSKTQMVIFHKPAVDADQKPAEKVAQPFLLDLEAE